MYTYIYTYIQPIIHVTERYCIYTYIQPIADRVAQNLEIISGKIQYGSRRLGVPGFSWELPLVPFVGRYQSQIS